MELTGLLQALVANTPHGLQIALAEINSTREKKMSEQVLNNKLNPYYADDYLNEPQIEAVIRSLNLYIPVSQFYACKGNAVVFVMPSVAEGDMALLDDFMAIAKELGDISLRFQQSFADGVLTSKEFKTVESEIDEAVAALARFKQSVKLRVAK